MRATLTHDNPVALDPAWLRRRFAAGGRVEMLYGDQGMDAERAAARRAASVLVPIVTRPEQLTVLFTRRTTHLKNHSGQISFPGGGEEPGDAHPEATALREAREEIGLDPSCVELLGRLSDYHTRTDFRVTPVVGLVAPLSWKATRVLRAHYGDVRALLPAMAATIAQQAIFLILLTGAYLPDFALHAWGREGEGTLLKRRSLPWPLLRKTCTM